jgi:hypothetical protein
MRTWTSVFLSTGLAGCLAGVLLSIAPLSHAQQTLADGAPKVAGLDDAEVTATSPFIDYFQPGLIESLQDEARQAVAEGRYQAAEDLLEQAFQAHRANFGLYDPGQLTVLNRLLEVLVWQEKWQQLDQRLGYSDWLARRIYTDDPEQLASSLLQQGNWHRAAAAVVGGSQSAWYLIRGKQFNWQAVSILENHFGVNDPRLIPILYRIVLDHYYQTVSIERRGMTSFDFRTDSKEIANGWWSSKNDTVQRSYRVGQDNLQRIREINRVAGNLSPAADALLQVYMGDWEFLHGNGRRAGELYQGAYEGLLAAGIDVRDVDAYFDQPRTLPAQQLEIQWLQPEPRDNESLLLFEAWSSSYPGAQIPLEQRPLEELPYSAEFPWARVELKLELDGNPLAFGRSFDYVVTGLNIIDYFPRQEELVSRAFAEIPLLKFRPRLSAGEFLAHDPIVVEYRFPIR